MPAFFKTIFVDTFGLGFEPGVGQSEYTFQSISSTLLAPRVLVRVLGVIVFFYGWGINQQSDSILRSLRKNDSQNERSKCNSSAFDTIYDENEFSQYYFVFLQLFCTDFFTIFLLPEYKIPYGGLFKYVSCANYFGEILEWFGFFLALQTYTSFLFLLGTMANLVPRALKYHQGYIKKMDNYPKDRKAVFPYIL